jgi:cytoskeleton protein RodZ
MREILHPGYGAQLAKARETQGLSVAEVAAKLKLTTRQVEAMEAEDAAHLPGEVFLRGFVRNYARLVGVDPNELVATIDAEAAVSATITAPSEGVALGSGGLRKWLLIPVLGLVLFIAIVALLYHWLRQGEVAFVPEAVQETAAVVEQDTTPAAVREEVTVPLALPRAPESTSATNSNVAANHTATASVPAGPAPATVAANTSNATPPASSSSASPSRQNVPPVPPTVVVPPPVVAPLPTPSTQADRPASTPAAESPSRGTHVLRFTASQDAWIQVVDGKGKRFSKLVRAGGSDAISGDAPFRLVVGEAAQVTLSYDGRVIDLVPYIGQKVARLTLE